MRQLEIPSHVAGFTSATFSTIDTLVTDAPPPEDIAAALAAAGVETRIVGPADTLGSGHEERKRYSR